MSTFNIFQNLPLHRDKADLVIRAWLACHEQEYTDFKRRINNVTSGDMSVLCDMYHLMKDSIPPEASSFYDWLIDVFQGKANLNADAWAGAHTELIAQCLTNKSIWLGIDIKTGEAKLCSSHQPHLLMVHADTPIEVWNRLPIQVRAYVTDQLNLFMNSCNNHPLFVKQERDCALEAIVFFTRIIFLSHAVFISGFLANLYDKVIERQEPLAYCMYNFVVFDHGLTHMAKILDTMMQHDNLGTGTMTLINTCISLLVDESIDMGVETKEKWNTTADSCNQEIWKEVALALRKSRGSRGNKRRIASMDDLLVGDKNLLKQKILQFMQENAEDITLAYLLKALIKAGRIRPGISYMTFHRAIEQMTQRRICHDVPQKRYGEIKAMSLVQPQIGKSYTKAKRVIDKWTLCFAAAGN